MPLFAWLGSSLCNAETPTKPMTLDVVFTSFVVTCACSVQDNHTFIPQKQRFQTSKMEGDKGYDGTPMGVYAPLLPRRQQMGWYPDNDYLRFWLRFGNYKYFVTYRRPCLPRGAAPRHRVARPMPICAPQNGPCGSPWGARKTESTNLP